MHCFPSELQEARQGRVATISLYLTSAARNACVAGRGVRKSPCKWQPPCTQHSPKSGVWEGGWGYLPSLYTLATRTRAPLVTETQVWHQLTTTEMSMHVAGQMKSGTTSRLWKDCWASAAKPPYPHRHSKPLGRLPYLQNQRKHQLCQK